MPFSHMHYFPLTWPFHLVLFIVIAVLIVFAEVGVLEYTYTKLGINRRYIFALLLLSLLGSYVNIPIAQLPPEQVYSGRAITFYGMQYVVPVVREWPGTVITLNLGGAVVPTFLSLWLILKNRIYGRTLLGVAIVTVMAHLMAHAVKGVGIAEPFFVPPLVAAAVALLLSRAYAPPLAYIAGSLGTLVGADLLNLGKIQGLGAPIASIGGAGTFDGIFLSGTLAVLLAAVFSGRRRPS